MPYGRAGHSNPRALRESPDAGLRALRKWGDMLVIFLLL